jgi:hypothetical protein
MASFENISRLLNDISIAKTLCNGTCESCNEDRNFKGIEKIAKKYDYELPKDAHEYVCPLGMLFVDKVLHLMEGSTAYDEVMGDVAGLARSSVVNLRESILNGYKKMLEPEKIKEKLNYLQFALSNAETSRMMKEFGIQKMSLQ